mgnify:CR=1 FL=1
MNKKLFLLPIIIIALLSGCNLYLDEEEPIADELKGYDKAEHIVNDTVDVTYQFQPNTRSITGSVLDYLVKVEADTILYFLDNTPIDYLPVTGGYVFAEISDILPYGLMSYVEWAGYDNGFYKVVTTFDNVALQDVFTTFELEVNKPIDYSKGRLVDLPDTVYNPDDYMPVNYNPDANILEPLEEEYSVVQDEDGNEDYIPAWSGYAPKRADEYKKEEDGDSDTESTGDMSFYFDSRNITPDGDALEQFFSLKSCPKWLVSLLGINKNKSKMIFHKDNLTFQKGWYWAVYLSRECKEIIHTKISVSDEIIESWKDNTVTWKFNLETGYNVDAKAKCFDSNTALNVTNTAKAIVSKLSKKERSDGNAKIVMSIDPSQGFQVPIWGPVYLIFRTSLTFDFAFNVCGKAGFTSTEHTRQGFAYRNGKKEEIKEQKSDLTGHAAIMGQAELKGEFHLGLGVGIGKGISLDFTVGPTLTAGINASAGLDFLTDDPYHLNIGKSAQIEGYITASIDGHLKARALFKEVLDIPVRFNTWDIKRETWAIYPRINTKSIKVSKVSDEWDFSSADFKLQYKYSGKGLLGTVAEYYPAINLYNWKTKAFISTYYPDESQYYDPTEIQTDKTLHYDLTDLEDDVLYMAAPILTRDYSSDEILEDKSGYTWFTSATPSIFLVDDGYLDGLRQIFVTGPFDSNGKTRVTYYGIANYQIIGASKLKNWGLKVTVRNNKTGKKIGNSQDIVMPQCKTREYKVKLGFTTTCRNEISVELQPFGDVIQTNGDKTRTYYNKDVVILREQFEPSSQDLKDFDNYDMSLTPTGL